MKANIKLYPTANSNTRYPEHHVEYTDSSASMIYTTGRSVKIPLYHEIYPYILNQYWLNTELAIWMDSYPVKIDCSEELESSLCLDISKLKGLVHDENGYHSLLPTEANGYYIHTINREIKLVTKDELYDLAIKRLKPNDRISLELINVIK